MFASAIFDFSTAGFLSPFNRNLAKICHNQPILLPEWKLVQEEQDMATLIDWIAANSIPLIGIAAVLCGVALMSLVMGRTAQNRRNEESSPQN